MQIQESCHSRIPGHLSKHPAWVDGAKDRQQSLPEIISDAKIAVQYTTLGNKRYSHGFDTIFLTSQRKVISFPQAWFSLHLQSKNVMLRHSSDNDDLFLKIYFLYAVRLPGRD